MDSLQTFVFTSTNDTLMAVLSALKDGALSPDYEAAFLACFACLGIAWRRRRGRQ